MIKTHFLPTCKLAYKSLLCGKKTGRIILKYLVCPLKLEKIASD